MTLGKDTPWHNLQNGCSVLLGSNDLDQPYFEGSQLIKDEAIASILAVPLFRGMRFLGVLKVISRQPNFFITRDELLMKRLANQVVVSIENAQLYRQLHYMAVLEERDRLARELHDHLAQGLGYLKVKSAITDDLLSDGNIEESRSSLLELKKAIQILYTDVREEIFNLRTSATDRMNFFSALQEYLEDYRTHYHLDVDLLVENECVSIFPSDVTGQLFRIIQEALTNVRRHSNANKVMIKCKQSNNQVRFSIEDNGQGFFPDQTNKKDGQHYGLLIMRERAESISGSLELDSHPGKGTRVIVRVPIK